MASLTGTKIKDTYDALLKVSDNGALDGTLQTITDGLGNNSALSLSTAGASVGGTLAVSGNATFDTNTLFVDAANNRVGVGTASPLARLEVKQSNSLDYRGLLVVDSATPNWIGLAHTGSAGVISVLYDGAGSSTPMVFKTADIERARFYSGGDISFRDSSANEAFYWDASAAVLSVSGFDAKKSSDGGTPVFSFQNLSNTASSSCRVKIAVAGTSAGDPILQLTDNSSNWYINGDTSDSFKLKIGTSISDSKLVIDSAGRVGIGQAPSTWSTGAGKVVNVLQLNGNGALFTRADETYLSQNFYYNSSDSGAVIDAGRGSIILCTAGEIKFFGTTVGASSGAVVSTQERMRITSGGNTRVGNTFDDISSRGAAFQVAGDESMVVYGYGNGFGVGIYMRPNVSAPNASTQTAMQFLNPDTTTVGSITTNASSTAYNTSSDYRLKEDWVAMEGALDRVDALKPVNFAWKSSGSRVDGFLAHELQEVVPEAVTGEKDATEIRSVEVSPAVYEDVIHPAEEAILDEEGNVIQEAKEEWVEKVLVSEAVFEDQEVPVYQGIDQSKIVPLLVAAIQELRAELNALKQA